MLAGRTRLAVSAAVVGASVAALTALSSPARADYYGAIAYATANGAIGYSFDYGSRAAAEQRALSECAGPCGIAIWFRNACGALAIGNHGWGSGYAGSRAGAESVALRYCAQNTSGCYIRKWVCTTR